MVLVKQFDDDGKARSVGRETLFGLHFVGRKRSFPRAGLVVRVCLRRFSENVRDVDPTVKIQ